MTKRFNSKRYQGKARVYWKVPGSKDIRRVLCWNDQRQEYVGPLRGAVYIVRRYEVDAVGRKIRRAKSFMTLEDARAWENRLEDQEDRPAVSTDGGGPAFGEVVTAWRKRRYPAIAPSTRAAYEKLLRLNFGLLLDVPVRKVTPKVVDGWISELISNKDRYRQGQTRKSFRHELQLLSTILNDYAEYGDDPLFVMPVKRRHRKSSKLRNRCMAASKDLQESEFLEFLRKLADGRMGTQMVALATVQFYQALRISEAAALFWEDFRFAWETPRESRIYYTRHICWIRGSKADSYLENGFKNSEGLNGMKEHPMLPPTFNALMTVYRPGATGLVFANANGSLLSYAQIQNAYNRAFEAAGLPYRSTHIMRHGGTRKTFNETGGDMDIARQQLGNKDTKTVMVYAQRHAAAFKGYADEQWSKQELKAAAGSIWQQTKPMIRLVEEKE